MNSVKAKSDLRACLPLIRFSWALFPMVFASSCALKTGLYNLDHYDQPLGVHEEPFSYWGLELSTKRLIKDHVDVVFGVGYNSGIDEGRFEAPELDETNGRWPERKSTLWDVHLGSRLFPLGVKDRQMIPYVGGGVGYFDYAITSYGPEVERQYGDWSGDDYRPERHYHTVACGYFTYWSAGFYVRLTKAILWQTEFRYEDDKSDNAYDMSGSKLTVGLGFLCH